MKILEDNARRVKPLKGSLKIRCPYCDLSLLLIEEGDCEKRYNWEYNNYGERKKYSYYVIKCPCCEEESNLELQNILKHYKQENGDL